MVKGAVETASAPAVARSERGGPPVLGIVSPARRSERLVNRPSTPSRTGGRGREDRQQGEAGNH